MFQDLERLGAACAVVSAIALCSCSLTSASEDDSVVHVTSLVNLIATPSEYDDTWVSVQGVVSVRPEGQAVFLSADDAAYGNLSNGVWLVKGSFSDDALRSLDGQWVGIRGIFDEDARGHAGLFAGTIREIDRLDALPKNGAAMGVASQ